MLYLNDKDIRKLFDYNEMMESVEKAYRIYGENKFEMPDRMSVDNNNNQLIFMPSFIEDGFGTKILTIFTENKNRNLPTIDGLLILNDGKTGEVLAILDGKTITELRTGAVGGVGIKYTTKNDASSIGLFGMGVQGLVQLEYACKVRNVKRVNLYSRDIKKTDEFIIKLKNKIDSDIEIYIYENNVDVVSNSDIIITATSSFEPVLPDDAKLLKGRSYIGIGSYQPDMREYPDSLFDNLDNVFIDTEYAKEESGDLSIPLSKGLINEDKILSFSEILDKKTITGDTTFYKSVGMALFDLVVGGDIYNKAIAMKIGQKINI